MANAPQYDAAAARADKLLEPDGSIQTQAGTVVSGPDAGRAAQYTAAAARADKLLQPNGSITTSGSGGTSTPPGGTSGQVQYNNTGVFAGAPILTDGTNVAVGPSAGFAGPLSVGSGANNYFQVQPPAGTYVANSQIQIRPGGSSGQAWIFEQGGPLVISASSGSYVRIAYPTGAMGFDFYCNGSAVNGVQYSGANAGSAPAFTAIGSDTNVGMAFNTKGTGGVSIGAPAGTNTWGFGAAATYYFSAEANPRVLLGPVAGNASLQFNNNGAGTLTAATNGSAISAPAARTISLYTSNASSLVERLRVDGSGNVNIAPSGPQASLTVNGLVLTAVYTVATLPAASAGLQGARATVTDATAPSFLGVLTGGGSVVCPVFCTGSAWLAG